MKNRILFVILALLLMVTAASFAHSAESPPFDPGLPRLIQANGKELVIYQPQVDYWTDYRVLHCRCAFSIKTGKNAAEKFGVAEMEAETVVDQANRVVTLLPKMRVLRFPNTSESEANSLRRTVAELYPQGRPITVSLDRVLAYLDPARQPQQQAVELNLDPPKIFHSTSPAILVMFMGEPQLQPVVKDRNDLMFFDNCNWPVFFDTAGQHYYLLNGDNWLMAADAVKGPWTPAGALPRGFSSLPADENWAEERAQVPGKRLSTPPTVFISIEPAELILTRGEPTFSPIPGTKLMRVTNTDPAVFLNSGDRRYYLLTAGRRFRAAALCGPWSSASTDLPKKIARMPDDNPAAFVKASVPGTTEAKDAVLLASILTRMITTLNDPPQCRSARMVSRNFRALRRRRSSMPSTRRTRSFLSATAITAAITGSGPSAAPPPARGPSAPLCRRPSIRFRPPIRCIT